MISYYYSAVKKIPLTVWIWTVMFVSPQYLNKFLILNLIDLGA